MRRFRCFGLLILGGLFAVQATAVEQLDLTTPETFSAPTSITTYKIRRITMDWESAKVEIWLTGSGGQRKVLSFTGAEATAYMTNLNKRNASVVSNQKWTLQLLVTNGYLAGTVSGTPD